MIKELIFSKRNNYLFFTGLIIFTTLNIFSACTMELHFDEAYYWLYSQHPALGYFDHPPMISWIISLGTYIFPGEFGVRIFSIIFSSLSMLFLWRIIKKYSPDPVLFWALVYSTALIHPYSFISTPDSPLFFFSVVLFYYYKKYLEKSCFQNVLILAFVIALSIYSKYHAVLIVFFILISNPSLFKKLSFWAIFLLVVVYLLPYISWQADNGFPSIKYHLIDSHKTEYNISVTINYILSELAVTGPFLGWLFLFAMVKTKPSDKWEKGLKYCGIGIFAFFLISTFGGDFEAHWTLVAFAPLIILSYKFLIENQKWRKWVKLAGIANFILLLALRIIIITPAANNIQVLKIFKANEKEAEIIKKYAGNTPVVFQDSWTKASLFAYYTNNKWTANLNSSLHRRNQFDLYDNDERLTGDSVLIFSHDSLQFKDYDTVITNKSKWYVKEIDNFHSFYNITFDKPELNFTTDSLIFNTVIRNPYEYDLIDNNKHNFKWQLYTKSGKKWILLAENDIEELNIRAKGSIETSGSFLISNKIMNNKMLYLTLKAGDLKPIPVKWNIARNNK